jgi:hypothetical protein
MWILSLFLSLSHVSLPKTMQMRALDWNMDPPFRQVSVRVFFILLDGACFVGSRRTDKPCSHTYAHTHTRDAIITTTQYSAVVVYHPNDGNNFALVGFPGFVGALTGENGRLLLLPLRLLPYSSSQTPRHVG